MKPYIRSKRHAYVWYWNSRLLLFVLSEKFLLKSCILSEATEKLSGEINNY